MKAKHRPLLYGVFIYTIFSPFPLCVIAPNIQSAIKIRTDKAPGAIEPGTSDFTLNSVDGHNPQILPLFKKRGDLFSSEKGKQIFSNTVCESHFADELQQDQFGPYNENSKRLLDLTLWPGEPPGQKNQKKQKKTHSNEDWLLLSDLSVKGKQSRVLNIVSQERQNNPEVENKYYSHSPRNIQVPRGPSAHAALSVHKEAFVEPHSFNGIARVGAYNLRGVYQNHLPFLRIQKDLAIKYSENSEKKKIVYNKSSAIDSTSSNYVEERGNDLLIEEEDSILQNNSLTNKEKKGKLGNLDEKQFLAFLSPLGNCNPKPKVSEILYSDLLRTFIRMNPVKLPLEEDSLEKVVNLMKTAMALNVRFLRFFHPGSDEDAKVEEEFFRNFLFKNNGKQGDVSLEAFLNQSPKINKKLTKYLRTDAFEKGLPARNTAAVQIEVSPLNQLALKLSLLFLKYYYKNTNQEKWLYLFGKGSRYLGFWATLKLKTERGNRIKVNDKFANYWKLRLFPWGEPWIRPPQGYHQKKYAPTLNEWQQYYRAKLSILEGVAKHFLPPEDSWMYERIRLGWKVIDEPSKELQENMDGTLQDLKHSCAMSSSFHNDVPNERIGRYNNESFFKKMEILLLRVYKLNFSFLNHVGKGSLFSVIEEEQKNTLNWLKQRLTNFLIKKPTVEFPPDPNIASSSSNPQNSPLLADLLEKIIQEQSKFDEDSGSFGTEVDDMITQLALVVLASYYEEVNSDKWKVLFARSLGSLEFVEFMVVCLKRIDATRVTVGHVALAEMCGLFPWADSKCFRALPASVRNFKSSAKKEFSLLEKQFSNKQKHRD
ncbi:hypothetical protein O181_004330 [Austropuccinia psidii MF-1]|uniref:Uncharacterized protein n=1 Tax=Austropuccinia psidii MF-1 TaxID=1389203 RepID=A0A9Q3BG66_9BASI|nr:hypothetical protein [Austropuccinia psidii MF-1]